MLKLIRRITEGLYRSVRRFPLSILLSALTALMLVIMSEMRATAAQGIIEILERATLTIALGIPLSLSIKIYLERVKDNRISKAILLYSACALLLVLYYSLLLSSMNMVSQTRYAGISLVLYLVFLYLPYLPYKEGYEKYIIKILTVFFITVLYSAVLYGGLAAILFTFDRLLGITVKSKIYYYTWLAVAFIFAPAYFLAGIPGKHEELEEEGYPKLLKILLLYIVMPLVTAYTAILYMYFIKIIFTGQWPKGLVSNLVLWYSVIDASVLFLITPLRHENKWAGIFLKWFPRVILPVLIMMFISMGIRINEYGITENRYFVLALGAWVTGIMIYYSFKKKYVNIVLPVTLSIVALVSVLGPFSSYSVSIWSQNRRLQQVLVKNNMLEDGRIIPAKNVSVQDKNDINGILEYFNNKHSFRNVKYLPEDFKFGDMEKIFGFPYEHHDIISGNDYFSFMSEPVSSPVDIRGYDYMFDSGRLYDIKDDIKAVNKEYVSAQYDPGEGIVKIYSEGKPVYEKDMKTIADKLLDKYGYVQGKDSIPSEDMVFQDENEKIKVKFVIRFISGTKDKSAERTYFNGAEFNILAKLK